MNLRFNGAIENCQHTWNLGPFYVSVGTDPYAEIHAFIQIEHCSNCGIIRLPEKCRKLDKPYTW